MVVAGSSLNADTVSRKKCGSTNFTRSRKAVCASGGRQAKLRSKKAKRGPSVLHDRGAYEQKARDHAQPGATQAGCEPGGGFGAGRGGFARKTAGSGK